MIMPSQPPLVKYVAQRLLSRFQLGKGGERMGSFDHDHEVTFCLSLSHDHHSPVLRDAYLWSPFGSLLYFCPFSRNARTSSADS